MENAKTITGWISKDGCPVIPFIYLAIPFCFLDVGFIHEGHRIGLLIGILIILALKVPNKWLRYFLLYAAILHTKASASIFFESLAFSSIDRKVVFYRLVFLIVGTTLYLAVIYSKTSIKWFYNTFCIGTIIQCVIAIVQSCGFDPIIWFCRNLECNAIKKLPIGAAIGTLGNNNFLAAMIVITFPFFFRKGWIYCLPILLYGLFITNTATAIIAGIGGIIIYLGLKDKSPYCLENIPIMFIFAISLLVYLFFIENNLFGNKRFVYWIITLENLWSDKIALLFGYGPRKFLPLSVKGPLHNEWLQGLYYYGLIGMSFIGIYVVTIFKKNKFLFVAFIIACINAIGNYPMHLASSAALILIIMGLIQREKENYGRLFNIC